MTYLGVAALALSMFCCGVLVAGRIYRMRGRDKLWEDVDPMSFVRRAEAMAIRHKAIIEEVKSCTDGEKLSALEAESQLILDNTRELRLEQMECQENGWRRRRDSAIGGDPR